MTPLPKNFKLITSFGLAIGILGVLAGLTAGANVLAGGQRVADVVSMKQRDPKMQEVQDRMMKESVELADRWRVPNGIAGICNLAISSLMIAGALFTSRLRRSGRKLLSRVLLASIIYDPIAAIPALIQAQQTAVLQGRVSEEMMKTIPNVEKVSGIVSTVTKVSLYMGMMFLVVWIGCKLWYYAWGRKRLAQPDVDELFAQHGS